MTWRRKNNTSNTADVFHGILEQDKTHKGIVIIILSQSLRDVLFHIVICNLIIESIRVDTRNEVTENEILWGISEVPWEIEFIRELLPYDFKHTFFVSLEILSRDETITVGTLALVDPELNEFIGLGKLVWIGEKKSLENIGHVSQVKLVVEVDGCFSEIRSNSLMEG